MFAGDNQYVAGHPVFNQIVFQKRHETRVVKDIGQKPAHFRWFDFFLLQPFLNISDVQRGVEGMRLGKIKTVALQQQRDVVLVHQVDVARRQNLDMFFLRRQPLKASGVGGGKNENAVIRQQPPHPLQYFVLIDDVFNGVPHCDNVVTAFVGKVACVLVDDAHIRIALTQGVAGLGAEIATGNVQRAFPPFQGLDENSDGRANVQQPAGRFQGVNDIDARRE